MNAASVNLQLQNLHGDKAHDLATVPAFTTLIQYLNAASVNLHVLLIVHIRVTSFLKRIVNELSARFARNDSESEIELSFYYYLLVAKHALGARACNANST